ncbi:hypothetical protein ACT26D_06320 [Megasphaera elsdenii]|uniref:hypothetical protein n=1 Tax=Megasphaera elsdenii TaxID=907 RepID=UPI004035EAD1
MYCNDTTTWNLLKRHLGHTLACVGYGNTRTGLVNIAIEDIDTNEVILDCDRPDWADNEAEPEKTSDVWLLVIDDGKYGPSYETYATAELATKHLESLLRAVYAKESDGYSEEDIQKAVFDGGWDDGNNFLIIVRQEVATK